jgi:hypothetical protein
VTQAGKGVPGDSHRENRAGLAEVRAQLRELQQMTGAMNEGAATVSAGGVILILTDLTAQRATESQAAKAREAMREQNAFLGQAREALGLGWWDAGATFYFTLDPQDSTG